MIGSAREVTPDTVDAFLKYLADERKLSASSVNHHRTILNGIFNFAVRRGKYDKNPVAAVRQRQEPPGRDRIVTPDEFRALWESAKGDLPMRAFLAFAGTTTMRRSEYVFPSKPTARCPQPERPYRWDFGKEFRALAKAANLKDIRIHDLRHAGATILMTLGVPDAIVRKLTGHRSRELERYQHLTPELRTMTVNLIATALFRAKRVKRESGTPTGTVRQARAAENRGRREVVKSKGLNGGVDGTRTVRAAEGRRGLI